jgi:AcrR family transcriptional regulator
VVRPSRKLRDLQRRRDEVLAAAERLFAHKGFFKTGMAEIAAEADVAVGSLYQFFDSKDAIYAAISERKFEEYFASAEVELGRARGVVGQIEALIVAHLRFFEHNRDFFRIYAVEFGGDCSIKGGSGERIQKQFQVYMDLIVGLQRAGVRQGLFKRLDPELMGYVLNGMMRSVVHQWILGSGEDSLVAKAGTIQDIFLAGVTRRRGAP